MADSAANPTDSTPAVLALARLGYPPRIIRQQLPDVTIPQINNCLKSARRNGIDLPPLPSRHPGGRRGGAHAVTLGGQLFAALAPPARRRGRTVNELVRKILDVLVAERLIDAVLDDADDREEKQ